MKSGPLRTPVCPRCKNSLQLLIQSENRGNKSIVMYMYICTVCRYKETIESVELALDTDKVMITRVVRKSLTS